MLGQEEGGGWWTEVSEANSLLLRGPAGADFALLRNIGVRYRDKRKAEYILGSKGRGREEREAQKEGDR